MVTFLVACAVLMCIRVPTPANGGNLLVLPLPTFSHTRNLMSIVHYVIATYNHTATVVTTDYIAQTFHLKSTHSIEIIISNSLEKSNFKDAETRLANDICHLKMRGERPSFSQKLNIVKACDDFHNDTLLMTQLKYRKYELAIVDNLPMGECFASLCYRLSTPYIYFGVLYDPVRMRIPFSPAATPFYNRFILGDKMSFSERLFNFLTYVVMETAPSYLVSVTDVKKYIPGDSYITASGLVTKAAFHLVETDFLMDYLKPSLPHIAFVGGIGTKPANPLPNSFQNFMDSSKYGAVVVSFGGGLNGFPQDRNQDIYNRIQTLS